MNESMKYNIEFLPTAIEDLQNIEDYYLMRFDSKTALKVSNHILDTIERLEIFPNSGSLTPDKVLNQQGYRMIICGDYVAIYKMFSDSIFIYHIFSTKMDYPKLFI